MMAHMAMTTEQLPVALALGAVTAFALSALVLLTPWPVAPRRPVGDATQAVGALLMSKYMMAFEGAAMLILAGIAGAVILGRREARPHHPMRMASAPPSGVVYTCPMHPEVEQVGPGVCPKCGMALVPATESPAPHGHDHHGAEDRRGHQHGETEP